MDENTLRFDPPTPAVQSVSVDTSNQLVAPTAEELLSANPALGILQERTQNMSASPSGTSIEKGLTVSGNLQFSDSISNEPTEIEAPNIVQVKGYFIQYFDKTNFSNGTGTMDIYVGDEELTYEQGIENQSSPASNFYNAGLATQYEVGDLISFRNKYSFICGGQITAISGNKITLGQFTDFVLEQMPTTTTWLPDEGADQTELNFDAYSLWNMNRPTLGSVVLNNIAFAFGANLNSLGKASFAQGFDSKAYGAYSIATGRGTTAGSYAQFVCGRNNSPDYNQKLLFIVGGGWGSDPRNVCTVDYGGNLVLAAGSYPQPSETASITATNGHFSGSIDVESSVSVGSVELTEESLQETENNISNLQTAVSALNTKTANMTASSGVTNFTGTVNVANFVASDSVSVGSVELTEESLQETQDNISALQTSVTAITSKTQNQSAASGNTSFTGNLTVSGTISTGSMSDIAGKVSQNQSAISGIQTDVSTLALSKLSAGTLHFNQGKLMVNSWANLPVSLPISICVEYDVDSWEGLGTGNQGLSFITASSVIWSDPAQLSGFTLRYNDSANRLEVILLNPGGASQSARGFSAYFNGGLSALPTGRHTIVFCASGEINAGAPSEYAMYVDGQAVGVSAVYFSTMVSTDLTSSGPLSVCQKINYSTPNIGGVDIPIRLSRVRIFNFQMDAEDSPYTVADYVSGKDVPPALYDPAAVQRALLALEDYTISRNATTRLVKDVSGNAYDATVVESGGSGGTAWTGTVKGSRDTAVAAFVDEIKTQINQANG